MDLEEFDRLVTQKGPESPVEQAAPAGDALAEPTLDALLDQPTTIEGDARDAFLGAVVLTDDRTPVYLEGLEEWPAAISGKRVAASGTFRRKSLAPDPSVGSDGGVSHGKSGSDYVLENPTWKTV